MELVDLYKAGSFVGTYSNIDAAFAAMTDSNGEYEIKLYQYEVKGALLLSSAVTEHHISAKQTPNVKKLTITGNYTDLGNDYYKLSMLYIDNALTANSDMSVSDLYIQGNGKLDIKSNTLYCLGTSVMIQVPLSGSMDEKAPSRIEIDENGTAEFYAALNVHTVRKNGWLPSIYLNAQTEIMELYSTGITISDNGCSRYTARIHNIYSNSTETPCSSITVNGSAKVIIDNVDLGGWDFSIISSFTKLENFADITLGTVSGNVSFGMIGYNKFFSTDINGNVINSWVEGVKPEDLKCPILKLQNPSVFARLKISIADYDTGIFEDCTSQYILNNQNQVVYKSN